MQVKRLECDCGSVVDLLPSVSRVACKCGLIHGANQLPTVEVEAKQPRIVSLVKKLAIESDRGAGDTVERLIARAGGRPLAKFKAKLESLGIDCGCGNRIDWLNATWPYSRLSRQP
jgi:hypothetical protein